MRLFFLHDIRHWSHAIEVAFSFVADRNTQSFRPNIWTFLLIAFVIGSAAFWFFDPMMELVQEWMGAPHKEIPKERRVATTLAVVAATLVVSVLHHSLATSLEKIGIVGFLVLMVTFAGTAGLTTHSWVARLSTTAATPGGKRS